MNITDISALSPIYAVRRLGPEDAEMIHTLCAGNPQFYRYSPAECTVEQVLRDLTLAPPGIPPSRKYYIGFFDGEALVAVMDLIDGYPNDETAFIGFFMVARDRQGKGAGSAIIGEALAYLRAVGYAAARLCIDEGNPQSTHFWTANGFEVIATIRRENGTVLLAERNLEMTNESGACP